MGDVLHYIDFHQLQIENKQYMAKIEERNPVYSRIVVALAHSNNSLYGEFRVHLKNFMKKNVLFSIWFCL